MRKGGPPEPDPWGLLGLYGAIRRPARPAWHPIGQVVRILGASLVGGGFSGYASRDARWSLEVTDAGMVSSRAYDGEFPALRLEPPNQPDIVALIDALDAYQRPLYPAESHHGIDLAALGAPNVLFAVARDARGLAMGCGAMVLQPGYGELKRMFTRPPHRGRGVAAAILRFLEDEARTRGCVTFMLETGYLQVQALALYERAGYVRCGPFGCYRDDPNSVFMAKPDVVRAQAAAGGASPRGDTPALNTHAREGAG